MHKNVVVCIGGMARTGSTVFCRLIAESVGALNVGELIRLNSYRLTGKETICSCGLGTNKCALYANQVDNFDFRIRLQQEFNIIVDNSKFIRSFFSWLFCLLKSGKLIYVFIYRNRRDVVYSIVHNHGPDGRKKLFKALIGWYFWTAMSYVVHFAITLVKSKRVKSLIVVNPGSFSNEDIAKVTELIEIRGMHCDHQIDGNFRYRNS